MNRARYPGVPHYTNYYYQDNVWDSGMEFVSSCGKCQDNDYTIGIRPLVKMKIDALMEEYHNIEWLAYLAGFIDHERGYAELTDLIIPESQSITSASVDDVERDFPACGVIHSHHNMNMSFSSTDWRYINSNNDISIVIYNGGRNMDCSMRIRAQCGAMTFIKPELKIVFNDEFDKDEFIRDARSKIHRFGIGEFQYSFKGSYGYNYGGRYGYSNRRGNYGRGKSVVDELEEEVNGNIVDDVEMWEDVQQNDLLEEFTEFYDVDGNKIRLKEDGSITQVEENGTETELSKGNGDIRYNH